LPEENDISDFLFELVSADRLALLSELSVRKQRLASLSKILNCSHQECSRNLIRLSNSGFIRKDPEGLYEITTFGSATLSLIPSFRFLIRERNYLLNHDLTFLPQGYVQRIGDLCASERVDHVSQVLAQIRAVISKGKEYVCLMTDQ
jgi:predicted transcriptional regulator